MKIKSQGFARTSEIVGIIFYIRQNIYLLFYFRSNLDSTFHALFLPNIIDYCRPKYCSRMLRIACDKTIV